ncbi:hypothetical protein SAMN05216337_1001207 [Bradyrhizobium brasilense]|uniref:Chromosome partitioning protein ParB n=1 Tax=Bradyrhizobium brasilense TaxID=1419277 RepID=A0A1G6INP4_9BRAD|nr:DUF6551 family protein [Bradyrhizobium brasilense]SDC08128.1 hypothetical protein SAMN05216337_1001207 [Bradyrhizobium brasilense]
MTLRPIKPLSFPDLSPAVQFGARPMPKWVAPTSLMVDGTYQRDLSERSVRLIRQTYATFRWNRYKPPIVVQTGPATLHVIDGQHTAIVAASLRIPEILILVVDAGTLDERARAFVGHNTDRIMVSSFDIYKALLASGDPDAKDVDNVCHRAGVRIRMISPSSAIAEGDTAAVGIIRSLVKRRGVVAARKVLQVLVKAKRAPITRDEILASDKIICELRTDIDLEELTAAIRIEGAEGLNKAHAKAKENRTRIWAELSGRWLRRIDRSAVG